MKCKLLALTTVLLLVGLPSLFAQDRVFLKSRPEGNVGYVVEIRDNYVVIRFPIEELIRVVRQSEAAGRPESSAETDPAAGQTSKSSLIGEIPSSPPLIKIPAGAFALPRLSDGRITTETIAVSQDLPDTGEVVGQVLFDGKALPGCKLKLVRLKRTFAGYSEAEEQSPLVTTSDSSGTYRFKAIPPGSYKLKWAPDGSDSWIRKVGEKPDVIVERGQASSMPALEINKFVIGR